MTEAELQNAVCDLARHGGWLTMHTRPAQTARGWRTPITGDPGYPDLTLAHPKHGIIIAELKTDRGRCTPQQNRWLDTLTTATSDKVRIHLWRPADWPAIVNILTPGAKAA